MGLTETVAPAFSNPMDPARRKLGAVGRASGCEARVVDAALQPVADGETGEIVIRGPNVMRGYYKNDEATRGAFTPDGWLRTGDLGHRDADGFFFVTGRIKELIIKGGENIAPREIDEMLLRHPAVLDAAAVGIPDRHYGQEIMACVVLREDQACSEERAARILRAASGPLQDAQAAALRARTAARTLGQGAAAQVARHRRRVTPLRRRLLLAASPSWRRQSFGIDSPVRWAEYFPPPDQAPIPGYRDIRRTRVPKRGARDSRIRLAKGGTSCERLPRCSSDRCSRHRLRRMTSLG